MIYSSAQSLPSVFFSDYLSIDVVILFPLSIGQLIGDFWTGNGHQTVFKIFTLCMDPHFLVFTHRQRCTNTIHVKNIYFSRDFFWFGPHRLLTEEPSVRHKGMRIWVRCTRTCSMNVPYCK
jgi:hypothetical protein